MNTKKRTPLSDKTMATLEKVAGRKLSLANLLWATRETEEMTQREFAKLLGVSAQYLCDVEHGRKMVSPKMAAEFAKRLKRNPLKFIRLALQDELDKSGLRVAVEVKAA